MNILVLGNSNSISPSGYIAGLRAQFPGLRVDNKSVGNSPGTTFAYYGSGDFSRYDAVIFDSVVNDEVFVDQVGGYEFLKSFYFELFSTIVSQTRLFVLGFCLKQFIENFSDIYFLQADLAQMTGATFVSVPDFLFRYGPEIVTEGAPLMWDAAHPHPAIAQQFGHFLGRLMASMPAPAFVRTSFHDNFRGISAATVFSGEILRKSTKLLSCPLAVMRDGDTILFDEAVYPLGLLVDHSYTRGYVRLEGPDRGRTQFLGFDPRNLRLILRFAPLREVLATNRLTVVQAPPSFEESHPIVTGAFEDYASIVSLFGIACWSGDYHHLPIERRGARSGRQRDVAIAAQSDLTLRADEMPTRRGWYPAVLRSDGHWARWTGPAERSSLSFAATEGRYGLELTVLGAVSMEALSSLVATCGGHARPVAITQQPDSTFKCAFEFDVTKPGPVDIELTVKETRNGYGLEVAGLRLWGSAAARS